jgi:hypothetical protein
VALYSNTLKLSIIGVALGNKFMFKPDKPRFPNEAIEPPMPLATPLVTDGSTTEPADLTKIDTPVILFAQSPNRSQTPGHETILQRPSGDDPGEEGGN